MKDLYSRTCPSKTGMLPCGKLERRLCFMSILVNSFWFSRTLIMGFSCDELLEEGTCHWGTEDWLTWAEVVSDWEMTRGMTGGLAEGKLRDEGCCCCGRISLLAIGWTIGLLWCLSGPKSGRGNWAWAPSFVLTTGAVLSYCWSELVSLWSNCVDVAADASTVISAASAPVHRYLSRVKHGCLSAFQIVNFRSSGFYFGMQLQSFFPFS